MTYRYGLVTGILIGLLATAATWWVAKPAASSGQSKPVALPAPAVVANTLREDQLNTIVLTPQAVDRLALRTAVVERKPLPHSRVYGGEIAVPTGQVVAVAAPLSGVLQAPPAGVPEVGQTVKKGQPLLLLLPLLTPEGRANLAAARVEADGQVKAAQVQLEAARVALDRAKRVFQSEAGSRKAVDEAQAQFDLAQKTLEAAASRRDLLDRVVGQVEQGTAAPLTIVSPEDGMLYQVAVRPGQTVPSGGALFEVVNLRRLWVRVPVPVGDLPDVDPTADAAVGPLALRSGQRQYPAAPAKAPPSAHAATGTVDLYYDLNNHEGLHRPGQRVGVSLTLRSEAESLAVPWSAIVHDIYGGTWLYEETAERTYVRRRVGVQRVVGSTAVLTFGPAVGAKVVSAGAAELFGTETGFTR